MTQTTRRGRKNWKRLAPMRALVFRRDNFTCRDCGWFPVWVPVEYDGTQKLPADWHPKIVQLELDHIHPFSLGGTVDESNLQTLCSDCNGRKFTKVAA